MKSQVIPIFDRWIDFMAEAYEQLSKTEFRKLEDLIRDEITFHRKRRKTDDI